MLLDTSEIQETRRKGGRTYLLINSCSLKLYDIWLEKTSCLIVCVTERSTPFSTLFMYLISNIRLVFKSVFFLLGDSLASEFYVTTFRNTHSGPPL